MVDKDEEIHLTGFARTPPQGPEQHVRRSAGRSSEKPTLPTATFQEKPDDIYSFGRICIEVRQYVVSQNIMS